MIDPHTERLTLHVPEILNDGSSVGYELLEAYERELLKLAGGFTLRNAIGAWRSHEGVLYREPVRLYSIDVPTASNARRAVAALALRIGHELGQQVVYLTVVPIEREQIEVGVTSATAQPAVAASLEERLAGASASIHE